MDTAPSSRDMRDRVTWGLAIFLFVGSLGYAIAAVSVGWHHTAMDLLSGSAFRQSQTALTAYYMVGRVPMLAYETPVVGPPWSIPFELPVYQWTVAGLMTVFDSPLEETGRFVSFMFFLLTLLPAWAILTWLGVAPPHRLVALSLLLLSPFYLYWSRTFLIESTALFFSLSYLAVALPCVDEPSPRRLLAATLLGILASLVKITTFAVYLPALMLAIAVALLRSEKGKRELPRRAVLVLLLGVVPTLAGVLWTRFADSQKELNPIGKHLTSTGEILRGWNFGSWEQRFDHRTWELMASRFDYAVGYRDFGPYQDGDWEIGRFRFGFRYIFPIVAVGVFAARRHRLAFLSCLLLFPLAPLVFFNLYWFHEYYAYANHVYLLAAVALGVISLLERGPVFQAWGLAALIALVYVAMWAHEDYYGPHLRYNYDEYMAVSATVQHVTQPDDVIVVLGEDWSSVLAYSCRRRALSIPWWLDPTMDKVPGYLALQEPWRPGAVVVKHYWRCDPADMQRVLRQAGYEVKLHRVDDKFDVYELRPRSGTP